MGWQLQATCLDLMMRISEVSASPLKDTGNTSDSVKWQQAVLLQRFTQDSVQQRSMDVMAMHSLKAE